MLFSSNPLLADGAFPWLAQDPPDLPDVAIWQVVVAVFLVLVVVEVLLYTALYRRPRADEALIRTGLGGSRSAIGHGLLVWPFIHTVKRVSLAEQTLTFPFQGDYALRWQEGERYEGHMVITVQVPGENSNLVEIAGRNIRHPEDPIHLTKLLDGVVRSTARDTIRTVRRVMFDIEPAAVEVRLTRGLDLAAAGFGLRVRAVHLHGSALDTGRLRRTLEHLETMASDDDVTRPDVPESAD